MSILCGTPKENNIDSHENLIKTHEELIEWRTKLCNINKSEGKYVIALRELNNLGASISQTLKDTDRVARKICTGTNRYELEYNNSLRIGKDSVKSLVELKQTATEIFADIKESEAKEFKEKLNSEPLYKELENLERAQARNKEFLKYIKLSLEGLQDIFNAKNKDKKCRFSDSDTASTNRTDPSTLAFSLFENSATNAATSSPLSNNL